MRKLNLEEPRVQQAVDLYKSGLAIRPICKELNMDGDALSNVLKQLGIYRSRSQAIRNGKGHGQINDHAFSILTPEALYWIGYLFADGHIEKSRPRITITTTKEDEEQMINFAKYVNANVTYLKNDYIRVAFTSQEIYDKLVSLNFNNRKSYEIVVHPLLKYSRDFWRGCVDGDGWVFKTKYPVIGLCGLQNTIEGFIEFLNLNIIDTKQVPYKVKKKESLYQCNFKCKKAIAITDLLYKDSTVYLQRKYDTYREFLNFPEEELV
jgi:hypothetical protein